MGYRKADKEVRVNFGGNAYMAEQEDGSLKLVHEGYDTVSAVPYDVPIVGYQYNVVNTLRLWNAEVPKDYASLSGTRDNFKKDFVSLIRIQAITSCLYPDDSSYEGKTLTFNTGITSLYLLVFRVSFAIINVVKAHSVHLQIRCYSYQ